MSDKNLLNKDSQQNNISEKVYENSESVFSSLTFRMYKPQNEMLKKYEDLIEVEPVDARNYIKEIIDKSINMAPDKETVKPNLSPKLNVDIKRMMKPQVDQLLKSTRETLEAINKKNTS